MAGISSPGKARGAIAPMYAPLSSVFARSSVMSTPVSTISKTTPVLDTAGPRKTETLPRSGWTSSLSAKMVFLAVVFVLVPVFLYLEFRRAYQESQELLLSSVRAESRRAISQSLLPLLETIDNAALPDLGRHLAPFASEVTTIKLLLRPAGTSAGSDAFYYLASWPAVTQSDLQAEHDMLAQQGVLERLGENCSGEMPFSLIYHRPTGGAEIVTAVTPLSTRLGCWAVVASFPEDAFPSAHLGQPYWRRRSYGSQRWVILRWRSLPFRRCSVYAVAYVDSPSARAGFASWDLMRDHSPAGRACPSWPMSAPNLTVWSRPCIAPPPRSGIQQKKMLTPSRPRLRSSGNPSSRCGAPLPKTTRAPSARSALSNTRSIGWTGSLSLPAGSTKRPLTCSRSPGYQSISERLSAH